MPLSINTDPTEEETADSNQESDFSVFPQFLPSAFSNSATSQQLSHLGTVRISLGAFGKLWEEFIDAPNVSDTRGGYGN